MTTLSEATSNSSDTILAGDRAASARLWEMPLLSFSQDTQAQQQPLTAEALEAIEAAAHAEGYQRGLGEGLAEGRSLGAQAVRDEAQRLRDLVAHLSRPLADLDAEVERTLIALTIEVARRLVDEQLQLDPALVASAVRDAVASLTPPPRDVRVHLHAEDAAILQNMPVPPDVVSWRLVADNTLRRGDVRLVTESATVDALLDTRQAGIARSLLGEHE
ncbi:FliH/SctL family protein [Hydrocarboniphaga sp.]|uniref:FliH/SctL family protein n=1 Tax=Hydrocarboniphaga sp. TaxID=2033016 RepID=UPI003D13614B